MITDRFINKMTDQGAATQQTGSSHPYSSTGGVWQQVRNRLLLPTLIVLGVGLLFPLSARALTAEPTNLRSNSPQSSIDPFRALQSSEKTPDSSPVLKSGIEREEKIVLENNPTGLGHDHIRPQSERSKSVVPGLPLVNSHAPRGKPSSDKNRDESDNITSPATFPAASENTIRGSMPGVVANGLLLPGVTTPFGGNSGSRPSNSYLYGDTTSISPKGWFAAQRKGKKESSKTSRKQCSSDDECQKGYFCSYTEGICKKVQRRINIAYLFYLSADRRFLSVLGLYMQKKGRNGFRMAFPFYWHFWGKNYDAKMVFPLFGRIHRESTKRTDTILLPFHHWKSKRGHGFNIWPFLFYSNYGKKGTQFTLLPFGHYEREGDFKGYGFLTPAGFYYGSSSRTHRTWALVPWAFGTATPRKAFTWTFPFNFYTRRGNDKKWFFMPFAYARRRGTLHRTFLFPLFYSWGDRYQNNFIGFPLVWHFSKPGRSTTLVLPFFHTRRRDRYTGGLFPLLLYGRNKTTGTRHVTLFPLFHQSTHEHGNKSLFYSLLFNRKVDRRKGRSTWMWTIPPILSHRTRTGGFDMAFPLFWRYFNKSTDTKIVGTPLFFYYRDRLQKNTFLFPLWWDFHHRGTGAYSRALLPLFYQQRSVEGRILTVAGPVYAAHGAKKPWHAGVAPLLFFGSGKKKHHAIVFPLFWHFRNKKKQTSTTVAGPFFWAGRKNRWHAGLAPLFFMGGGKKNSYATLFPLLWYHRDKKKDSHTAVAGPLFAHWGAKGWKAGLAPLLFFGDKNGRSHHIFAPLFGHWHDRNKKERTLFAGPSYYWQRKNDWGWGLVPFVYFRRGYKNGYVSSKLTILPFLHHQRSRKKELLITPLGGYMKRSEKKSFTGVAGPVVWHRSPKLKGWAVLPWVYHWKNRATQVTTTIGFPYIRQKSPEKSANVLFPFYWRFKDKKESSLVLFPFYWHLRQKEGWKADVVFPFYWNMKNANRRIFMIPPYYRHESKSGYTSGVFPFYHYKRNHKLQTTWMNVFPFVWYSRDDKKKTEWLAAGPYYESKTPASEHKGLVPFLYWGRKVNSHYRIGFPLYWDFQNKEKDSRTIFAGPFFYHRKATERGGGMLPLVWYRSDPAGMKQLTLAPLFHVKKDPTRFTFYTALFGWSNDRATKAHHGYVGPYIWRSDSTRRNDIFFPLYWRFKNKKKKTTTTFIPPLLFWSKHSPEKKVDLVFPIFWSSRRITGRTTVVFPFWWDKHEYYKSRTTALFPLFYRKRNYPEQTSTWLLPPSFYYKKTPKKTHAVLFPVFWHFSKKRSKGRNISSTVGFPLYWDFKRANSRTTIAFPFVWYFDRPKTKTVVVLNTYYRRNKKNNTYKVHCVPFFRFGRPRPGDLEWSVLGGVVGYRRIGRNRILRLLWIPIDMEPLPAKQQKADSKKELQDVKKASRSVSDPSKERTVKTAEEKSTYPVESVSSPFDFSRSWTPF